MSIQRRKFLQSATALPLAATLPGIAQAAEPGLYLGQRRILTADQMTIVGQGQVTAAFSYLNTVNARGVFIDIVPEPVHSVGTNGVGAHSGICFHAAPKILPNGGTQWQQVSGPYGNQNLWYQGVGVIFYRDLENGIGYIWSEQWVVDTATGGPGKINNYLINSFPLNTILRVTATTNYTTRQTNIAVYSVNQQGNVTALLGAFTLTADVIGDYAGVFAIDAGGLQVTPNALYY